MVQNLKLSYGLNQMYFSDRYQRYIITDNDPNQNYFFACEKIKRGLFKGPLLFLLFA
jgi:hypothetical protein